MHVLLLEMSFPALENKAFKCNRRWRNAKILPGHGSIWYRMIGSEEVMELGRWGGKMWDRELAECKFKCIHRVEWNEDSFDIVHHLHPLHFLCWGPWQLWDFLGPPPQCCKWGEWSGQWTPTGTPRQLSTSPSKPVCVCEQKFHFIRFKRQLFFFFLSLLIPCTYSGSKLLN